METLWHGMVEASRIEQRIVHHGFSGRNLMASIVLFGPPGAGKGTQAALIMAETGLPQVSTGDMLRAALAEGSALGLEAKKYMDAGLLVPDSVIIGLIEVRVKEEDASEGVLFDGFPRTIAQAEALELIEEVDAVVSIEVPDEKIVDRICGRYSCGGCGAVYHDTFNPSAEQGICDSCSSTQLKRRADDNEETVRSRLEAYHSQTAPLAKWYDERGKLVIVDGDKEIAEVGKDILSGMSGIRD